MANTDLHGRMEDLIMGLDKLPLKWHGVVRDQAFQPGDVLKLRSGQLVLVGDVNTLLGVCDDCMDFMREDIVAVASIWKVMGNVD